MSWQPYTSRRRSWQTQFHHLNHHKARPRWYEPRDYFRTVDWPKFEKTFLILAISKLATEERLTSGPVRTMYRRKRVRAVAVFRSRFGTNTLVERDSAARLPRL